MTESVVVGVPAVPSAACDPRSRVTKSFLGYGVVAGPFYVVVVLLQALFRPGFDIAHDDASLLANGSLGWIQIGNFIVTGLMIIACAVGVHRALRQGRGSTWGPRLLGLYGLALIAAGIFVADPMNGFPAGAPAGRPIDPSLHGALHIAAAGIGFLCLVAACLVYARRFSGLGLKRWAIFSRVTGIAFLLAFGGLASGSSAAPVVLGFWAALLLVWGWIAALALHLYRHVPTTPDQIVR